MDAEALHRAKIRLGVGIASYEAIALAVDNPELVPRITDVCHRYPAVAAACVAWTAVHLLRPWIVPGVLR